MSTLDLIPILMVDIHTPVEPKQLHPLVLENAIAGKLIAFDYRDKSITIQADEMPEGKRLCSRVMLVFLPDSPT
jgi:hypothetical protein